MANLAIRGYDIQRPYRAGPKTTVAGFDYPGCGIELLWEPQLLCGTNFEEANQFVKRAYRAGW